MLLDLLRKRQRWHPIMVSKQALSTWTDTTNPISPTSSVSSSLPPHGVREKCQTMLKPCGNLSNPMLLHLHQCIILFVRLAIHPTMSSVKQALTGMESSQVLVLQVCKRSNSAMWILNHRGPSGCKKHFLASPVSMTQERSKLNSLRK